MKYPTSETTKKELSAALKTRITGLFACVPCGPLGTAICESFFKQTSMALYKGPWNSCPGKWAVPQMSW